ncbi:MAG: hypothetical protein KJZ60_09170 [Ignavibacteriaceae bacterium]|nr:hypothetical protein [Ignavibacteriaceae bacterium]
MILFIAPYPNKENEKDGLIQRINEIDKIYENTKRTYVEISYRKHWILKRRKVDNHLTIYKLNFIIYLPLLLIFFLSANAVYTHALINAARLLPFYFFPKKKIYSDIHGLGPEESALEGRRLLNIIFSITEKIVVSKSYKLIFVTNQMRLYLENKYKKQITNFILLPIIEMDESLGISKTTNGKKNIIYSGGIQKWQLLGVVFDFVRRMDNYRYYFFSGTPDFFSKNLKDLLSTREIKVGSVSKPELNKYYQLADFGFVLREDSPINRVACPTKLVEYMSNGVLPIVVNPIIGDFFDLGYNYFFLQDLIDGIQLSEDELNKMRVNNKIIIQNLRKLFLDSSKILLQDIH